MQETEWGKRLINHTFTELFQSSYSYRSSTNPLPTLTFQIFNCRRKTGAKKSEPSGAKRGGKCKKTREQQSYSSAAVTVNPSTEAVRRLSVSLRVKHACEVKRLQRRAGKSDAHSVISTVRIAAESWAPRDKVNRISHSLCLYPSARAFLLQHNTQHPRYQPLPISAIIQPFASSKNRVRPKYAVDASLHIFCPLSLRWVYFFFCKWEGSEWSRVVLSLTA